VTPVKLHASCEGYQGEMLAFDVDKTTADGELVYSTTRMLPPG
jgi:hypothetical protein